MEVKLELKYGFWMAFALFIWWIIEYMTGIQENNLKYLSLSINASFISVIIVGLFLVLQKKKSLTPTDDLKYGTLALSAGITLLAAALFILLLSSLFYHFINPNWQEYATELNLNRIREEIDAEKLQKKREMYMALFAPGSMGMQNFARFVMYGFFILFVESLVVLKLPSKK